MSNKTIPKLFSLDGKVAVVTGSLGLIGKNHCRALAEAGANIVVTDLDQQACDVFASELSIEYSIKALGLGCDITNKESVIELKDRILELFSKIDVLVNNAAINDMFETPLQRGNNQNLKIIRWNYFSVRWM